MMSIIFFEDEILELYECCIIVSDWMQYGKNADYNTVWVQLSEENAATFDESKAWAYIDEHMGIDYGWQNVIMGWLVWMLTKSFTKIS